MKKLLIPILCCLLAVTSCQMINSYQAQNMRDIVTMDQGRLVNDNGVVFNIVEVGEDVPELEEGYRYYVLFDILNQNLDIFVKDAVRTKIINAQPVPDNLDEIEADDPIEVSFYNLGAHYWDIGLYYYDQDRSDFYHTFPVYYGLEDGGQKLHLYVFHEGDDENPAKMSMDELVTRFIVISVPIAEFKDIDLYALTCDVLTQNTPTGEYEVVSHTITK